MSITIIIILITAIIVAGIAATAVQQHNERKDQQKREEISKHKNALEETEHVLAAATSLPVSKRLIKLLRIRSLRALKNIHEQSPMPELKQKIVEGTNALKAMGEETSSKADLKAFSLPQNDKTIIKYIQTVKKLRIVLRSERTQGAVEHEIYLEEDKQLEQLQLRVNVETLHKRAADAINSKMQGSARQYLEKAVRALVSFKPQDEYTQKRGAELKKMLSGLENSVKDKNLAQAAGQKADGQEIDDIFAPKKKW
ncbi:MAG: hypothetical protein AAGJ37_07115 [Pseudomonadota bacterium]